MFSSSVQSIVIAKENRQFFSNAIEEAKNRYKIEVINKLSEIREKEIIEKWEVPLIDTYKSNAKQETYSKSIMKPFFITNKSEPEEVFMSLLDSSNNVVWWYKNREGEKKYFAVPYMKDGKEWAFYVDFIVKFKNGLVGLFDSKSGTTAKDAGLKAEALQAYIKEQNKNGKKLIGGIVIPKGKTVYINDNDKYEYDPNNLSNWKILEL